MLPRSRTQLDVYDTRGEINSCAFFNFLVMNGDEPGPLSNSLTIPVEANEILDELLDSGLATCMSDIHGANYSSYVDECIQEDRDRHEEGLPPLRRRLSQAQFYAKMR